VKIQILGTGCPKCQKLYENVQDAVAESGAQAEIIKVTDLKEISSYGVMVTPALAIDGVVKILGKVPLVDEIFDWLA